MSFRPRASFISIGDRIQGFAFLAGDISIFDVREDNSYQNMGHKRKIRPQRDGFYKFITSICILLGKKRSCFMPVL